MDHTRITIFFKYIKHEHQNKYDVLQDTNLVTNVKRKEGSVSYNDAFNTFFLRLYDVRHMVKENEDSERGTRCRHMGYFSRLAARVLLYELFHRQDNTYHGLCYTSRGALAGTRRLPRSFKNRKVIYLHTKLNVFM